MVRALRWRHTALGVLAGALILLADSSCRATDDLLKAIETQDQITSSTAPLVAPMRNRGEEQQEEFIPLLAPKVQPSKAASLSENLFHGSLRERELYMHDSHGAYDLVSRLDSRGSLDRIQGQAVSLDWNGQYSYRSGTSYTSADDYRRGRLRMFEIALNEKFRRGGMAREGRFLPADLPGMGYVDGLLVQNYLTKHLQLGFTGGARPERREMDVSVREPIASAYAVYERGTLTELYYAATLGVYQTYFNGTRDETSVLYDQRSDFGPKLNLWLSSQVNFNTGAAVVNTQLARLTRADLNLTSPLTPVLMVRAGLNHFELPDTAAQRDLEVLTDTSTILETGYWRYWVGSSQNLPLDFRLDEEFDLFSTPGRPDIGQVRGTVSRHDIFLPQDMIGLTVYTLNQTDNDGLGAILSVMFPLLENRLNLTANTGVRYTQARDEDSRTFRPNDASVYVNWLVTKAWMVNVGMTQTYQDTVQSSLIDFSLSYRW